MDADTVKSIDLSLICQPPGYMPKTKKDEEKRELRQTFSYDFNVTKISQLNALKCSKCCRKKVSILYIVTVVIILKNLVLVSQASLIYVSKLF